MKAKQIPKMQIKEELLNVFQKLSIQNGLYNTTLDDLAKVLKMSKKTIYKYYQSKDELVEKLVDRMIAEVTQIADSAMQSGGSPMERYLQVFTNIGQYLCGINQQFMVDISRFYPELFQKMNEVRAGRLAGFTGILESGMKSGDFKPLNCPVTAKAMIASIEAVLNPVFLSENRISTEEAVQTLKTIFLSGVLA